MIMGFKPGIHTLSSGSGGNSTLIIDNDTPLLIDAGISARGLCSALAHFGLVSGDLAGILITHEHSDHIKGLNVLLKNNPVPIYTPRTIANHIRWSVSGANDFVRELPMDKDFFLGGLKIRPFPTPHDTPQSVGYRIKGSLDIGYCTDCGHISQEVLQGMLGVDSAVIEANHDIRLLMDGPYPASLKRRILSDRGHLSNTDCGALALKLAASGTVSFILAHLSRENNTPRLAMETVSDALSQKGFIPGENVFLAVAPEKDIFSLEFGVNCEC